MRAGRLAWFITVQRATESQGAFNETAQDWHALFSAWAEKIEQGGREFFANAQTLGEVTTIFQTHFRPDVKITDRVLCDGRTYDIRAVTNPGNTRERIALACVEHVSGN